MPQCVLWGYGWAVWYALALNKTKWILVLVDCLYYHTILGIVASNIVLAVVMYCLILSFPSTKEYILKTKVHNQTTFTRLTKATARSAIYLESLRYPMSHLKATVPARTCSHILQKPQNQVSTPALSGSTPIPPFTPSPPRPHSPAPPSVSHQKKEKRRGNLLANLISTSQKAILHSADLSACSMYSTKARPVVSVFH